MKITKFSRLLDAKGPHLVTWDVSDRMAAVTLLANSDAARAALGEALALDRALTAAAPEVSQARLLNFVDRVVAATPVPAPLSDVKSTASFRPWPRSFQNGLAAAFATACFVVGIMIGSGVETRTSVDLAGLPLGPTTTITIGIE